MRGRCLAAMARGSAGATWRHAYQVELREAAAGALGASGVLSGGYVARDRLNMGRGPIPLSVGSWPSWGARCEFLPDMQAYPLESPAGPGRCAACLSSTCGDKLFFNEGIRRKRLFCKPVRPQKSTAKSEYPEFTAGPGSAKNQNQLMHKWN